MNPWIALQCPTCGARLQVEGRNNEFRCTHCGTAYLLRQSAGKLSADERSDLNPLATYTTQTGQWFRAGSHEICVHTLREEPHNTERFLLVDVEYRNSGKKKEPLSCRRNQWVLFDTSGYTYDPSSDTALLNRLGLPPLTGERFAAPGMHVRGWLAFKLTPSLTPQRLQFLTGFLDTHTVELTLNMT